nr:class I adenylate-forming enzyme family protein [Kibdelosporangium sp. MJ126-NF4]CEL14364.1 Long-chain-fatty-acid--CoA ligase [Kibdelosporangium sp. MJ126-NF4]CTQ88730.1 Long-chain-fatty-acid--CoA ligase (EC 6.2.1.3) [Kibdelosporangium sp. MJ126-NF4]
MPADLLVDVLNAAREHRRSPAVTDSRETITYGGLLERVLATAQRLRANGFADGDRMLFSVRPGVRSIVLALGAVAAGGTVVFVDPGNAPELFASRMELVQPTWAAAESMLYAAGVPGPVRAIARRRGLVLPPYAKLDVRHIRSGPWLPGVPHGALSAQRLAEPMCYNEFPAPSPDRDAVVVFTSGTTAAPKAVVHTRGSLGSALRTLAARCSLSPGDQVHTDHLTLGLPALVAGAQWTITPKPRPGATHTILVPTDLADMLGTLPSSLRQVMLGSAPVLPPLLRRARQAMPDVEFLAVYGMTEILPVSVATAEEKLQHRGDLLGTPLPGVNARVAADGELLVSGANLCRGYLGAPPMTEHATGDLARMDDGRIVLMGRKKDMILRDSLNVYPGLYEPAIAALPGVADAAMVGVPDEIGDEKIVVAVVADEDGPPDLAAKVRSALPGLIDSHAIPDEVVVLPSLPVSGRSRKIDRDALRDLVTR